MQKRQFLQIACNSALTSVAASALAMFSVPAMAQSVDSNAVVRQYGELVFAAYSDNLTGALEMQKAISALLAAPSAQTLNDARKSWLAAREWYLQTEAFRFYGGPIDNEKGPEGRINSWPMDESYVDYVAGKPKAGLINDRRVQISKASLSRLSGRGGEENVSTGWHAIEFILWGQDVSITGPGDRPFEDFVDGKKNNADRRRTFLQTVTELLVDDLRYLVTAWTPSAPNYRAKFERDGTESIRKMFVGLGSLSRGELAGERMEVAMNTQDQEDEHSCFSDNTHRDVVGDALGIENVWLARFKRRDGSVVQGASLFALVAAKDAAIAERVSKQIRQSVVFAEGIPAPFDQAIKGANDAPGRVRIRKTIDSLVQQSKDLADAAGVLGITRLTQAKSK